MRAERRETNLHSKGILCYHQTQGFVEIKAVAKSSVESPQTLSLCLLPISHCCRYSRLQPGTRTGTLSTAAHPVASQTRVEFCVRAFVCAAR